jgi:hypothetical protein
MGRGFLCAPMYRPITQEEVICCTFCVDKLPPGSLLILFLFLLQTLYFAKRAFQPGYTFPRRTLFRNRLALGHFLFLCGLFVHFL